MNREETIRTYIVERAAVLRDNIQGLPQTAIAPSINTVTVRCTQDIRSGLMDRRVDHVRRRVEKSTLSAINDLSIMVDLNEIALLDHAEGNTERVDPEGCGVDGIAEGDVTGDTLVEAVFAEDAEGGGETAFEVVTLGVLVGEFWGRWEHHFH